MEILNDIVICFLLSILVTLVCSKLKLPATVGFLLTGVLCGPTMLGLVNDMEAIEHVAELGVAMLLFTIGMELSGEALSRLKRPVFLGGSLQIGLTVLAIAVLTFFDGKSWATGIFWGCLVALSSSAIVLRILQEKGATTTPSGRLSLAILVFQDIMVAPMMLCVPMLAGTLELTWSGALFSCGKVVLILGVVLLVAHYGLDRLMEAVMRTRTRELLLLTTLGLCFGMAQLTSWLNLSLSLGAFLAGLLLARSRYSMSVISGILPYRDVFMSLFFISVGMMLDMNYFTSNFLVIIGLTLYFVLVKSLLTLPAVLVQGYPLRSAIITSLSLAQVGEFAFVLAASGLAVGLFDDNSYQQFMAVSVLTMMLTPGMIAIGPRLAAWVGRKTGQKEAVAAKTGNQGHDLEDHLIIVGFGISGRHLATVARESGIAYTILEMNPETVRRYQDKEPIMHGDATQPVVLEHLGVHKARVLAIIISDPAAVRAITIEAHNINPNLRIVARTRFVTEVESLCKLGADEVIAEEFETSIEVFSRVLTQYLVPRQDIDAFADRFRKVNYRMTRPARNDVDSLTQVASHLPEMGVQALRVCENSALCGQTLAESGLRPKYGVTLVALHRGDETIDVLGPQTVLEAGDIAYVFGRPDKLFAVKPLFSAS